MKRGWKIFWIVIATIVVMGLIFCGAALVLGFRIHDLRKEYPNGIVLFGDDDMEWDDDPLENEYLNPEAAMEYDDITELEMILGGCDVELVQGTDEKLRVDTSKLTFGDTGVSIRMQTSGSRLKIYMEKGNQIWDVCKIKNKNHGFGILYIEVPASVRMENITLHAGAANVMADGLYAKKMELKIGAADCDIRNADVDNLVAEVGAGDLEVEGTCNRDVDLKCGAGEMDLDLCGNEKDFNYSLKCGAGEIEIADQEYGGLAVAREIDNGSSKTVEIVCGAGDVSITFVR